MCLALKSYLVMMAPDHDFPQESMHLHQVGTSLFVYVGYNCWVACSNQHCLVLVLVLEPFQGQRNRLQL